MSNASKVICLISLLAAVVPVPALKAQNAAPDAVSDASDEAIRREYDTLVLRKTLVFARSERQQGNLAAAATHYQECYVLAQRIGPFVDPELQEIIGSFSAVLMEQAALDQKKHHYAEAQEKYDHILKMDPKNQAAHMARRENLKLLEAQRGRIPSAETTGKIPSLRTNDLNVATLVQDGKFYYEAGRMDEAEDKLNRALQMDPSSVAANYYLRLVKERRMSDATRRSELESADALLQVEKSWDVEQRNGRLEPRPNSFNRTNLVYTSKGRQNILSKLDRIRVDEVKFDNLPLPEVIKNLSALAKQRDPDKEGINFMMDRQAGSAGGGPAAIDPTTQLPIPTSEAVDITAINIKIDPPLYNVRLADVLDAIVRTSEKPIKYSILDYTISFSTKNQEPVPLEIRTFRVDPNTFRQGLESVSAFPFGDNITTTQGGGGGGSGGTSSSSGSSGGTGGTSSSSTTLPRVNVAGGAAGGGGGVGGGVGGGGGGAGGGGLRYVTSPTNTTDSVNALVRQFFIVSGIDFNTNQQSGKTFIFNDRKGVLTVRATAQDLDMIAAAIETLNQSPPQVNIKAKFAEITQNDSKALGFNWTLGGVSFGGGNLLGSGGTQPSLSSPSTTANPNNGLGSFFPGVITPGNTAAGIAAANTTIAPASSDGVLAGSSLLRNPLNAPTIGTLTGIMTDPQFRVAMQALEQRDGVDLLTAPEVTTESGRQAEMQAVDLQTIVTQNTATTGSTPGFSGVQSGVNSPIVNQPVLIQPGTQLLPFGPVLDVIPYVSADEFTIQMTIIPTITEFIGYDDPGQFVVQAQQAAGSSPITAQLPLPHFRTRQVTTSVCVWDAQTVVMGGLITDSVTKTKDKVPMLGDLPLVGRLFRSESSSKSKKNLMIFVTPTIINPDGTRYHSDEEMPFIQNGIPPQKSAVTP